MLTVDYERLGAQRGDRVLDLGCGAGRHAFESARRGCVTVASDRDHAELRTVAAMFAAMAQEAGTDASHGDGDSAHQASDRSSPASTHAVLADATALPYPNGAFDRIIAAEVLEHIDDDEAAIAELARVLRPGGTIAVTVPAKAAERVCWALSSDYHAPAVPGGHVRIYSSDELRAKLSAAGLSVSDSHGAHGLHTPYWWLRCVVGPQDDDHWLVTAYHRLLVWDITEAPKLTRTLDRFLNLVLPKSLVLYAYKAPKLRRPTAPRLAASPEQLEASHAG